MPRDPDDWLDEDSSITLEKPHDPKADSHDASPSAMARKWGPNGVEPDHVSQWPIGSAIDIVSTGVEKLKEVIGVNTSQWPASAIKGASDFLRDDSIADSIAQEFESKVATRDEGLLFEPRQPDYFDTPTQSAREAGDATRQMRPWLKEQPFVAEYSSDPTWEEEIPTAATPAQPKTAAKHTQRYNQVYIDRAAERFGVNPKLIAAVAATESSWDPLATNKKSGAQGLMQLMPKTAKQLGVNDSYDSEQNIMGGTQYLAQLLEMYDGDLEMALTAYNWGMGNLKEYGMARSPSRKYVADVIGRMER